MIAGWLHFPFITLVDFKLFAVHFIMDVQLFLPESLKTDDLVTAITNLNPTHISLVSAQLQKV